METASIDQFLAEAVRAVRTSKDAPWTFSVNVDLNEIWPRLEYHGIVLVLHAARDRLTGWPSEMLGRIAEEARLIALWEATHHKLVAGCIDQLASSGIEAVVMKGTALAYSLHAVPETRKRGDTDLLVHPDTMERTRQVLGELGWYRKDEPHGLYFQEGWQHRAAGFFVHSIDLHWKPVDRPVLHDVLPLETFFQKKEPMPRFSSAAFRPDWPTMVLHAVINQKWHADHGYDAEQGRLASKRRLIWSIDFDLMAAAMTADDWDMLTDHCVASGVAPLVGEALKGAQDDLGTSVPEDTLARLLSARLDSDLESYFANSDSLSQFWLDLRNTAGVSAKSRLVLGRALPPREHLMIKYPDARNWPTLLLQARMLIGTAGRLMRRTLS